MRKKTITLILLSLITLGLLGLLLWLRCDHSLDRSGWAQREGRTVYLDASGDPVRGWMELEGDRYYFDETGALVRNQAVVIEGKNYVTTPEGILTEVVEEVPAVPAA